MSTLFLIIWLIIGLASSLVAILVFRPNGTTKSGELVMAALGPFFGPIVTVLMILDLVKRRMKG